MASPGRGRGEPAGPTAGPPRRTPARFSWAGIAVLGAAGVVAFAVTAGVFLPALSEIGSAAARDPANLPDTISVCGRDWTKDTLDRALTRAEVFLRTEAEPIVVTTGPIAACPAEVGAAGDDPDGMATVVYVRTGEDAFVPYSLVGGP